MKKRRSFELERTAWTLAVSSLLCCVASPEGPRDGDCTPVGHEPCVVFVIEGEATDGELGFRFGPPRDADGDGIGDLAAGARFTPVDGQLQAGVAGVWSGGDGKLVRSWSGDHADGLFGHLATLVPDLDGDGLADVLIAAPTGPGGGVLSARSVTSGAVIWQRRDTENGAMGWHIAPAGDQNGDGVGDVFASVVSYPVGRVELLSGVDGTVEQSYLSESYDNSFGFYVVDTEDLDGDGRRDLVVGAHLQETKLGVVGAAYAISSSGTTLHRWTGDTPLALFGEMLAALGDLDGDGQPEIAIGAPHTESSSGNTAGEVWVYSGASDRLLHHFVGQQHRELYGRMISSAGDYDEDGIEDIAVGAPWHEARGMRRAGRFEVRSGATGELLFERVGTSVDAWIGWHITPAEGIGPKGSRRGLVVSSLRHAIDGRPGVGVVELLLYP